MALLNTQHREKTMKRFGFLLVAVICATFAGGDNADAQQSRQVSKQRAVQVVVPPKPNRPLLGVDGHYVGTGYKLSYVAPHSLGQRMGLEKGDIIMRINGRFITDSALLIRVLDDVARYADNGINPLVDQLSIEVENIRWHWGQSNQRYVRLEGNLFR